MFPLNDGLDVFLFGGFLFGLLFTIGSLLLGIADIGIDHGGDVGHGDVGHGGDHGDGPFNGLLNLSSILGFITWGCGVAYVVKALLGWPILVAGGLGLIFGLIAAVLVTMFLVRVLGSRDEGMVPADWETTGTLGHVSSSIRGEGFGEIVYEKHGSRHSMSARSDDAIDIPRGTEVVIMRTDRGVAFVTPWDRLLADSAERSADPTGLGE